MYKQHTALRKIPEEFAIVRCGFADHEIANSGREAMAKLRTRMRSGSPLFARSRARAQATCSASAVLLIAS